jgi:hypothetical protein
MRKSFFTLLILIFPCFLLFAQETASSHTRFVIGVSGPELFHAGITYRIANASQFGLSAGAAPSLGKVWSSLNLEHRLYLGKNALPIERKVWFFRQGTTFFPSASSPQQFTLTGTVGKDFLFKNGRKGITIDAGVFYLPKSERSSIILVRSLDLWPALRFQFFFPM